MPRLLGAWTTDATHDLLPGVVISGRSPLELLGVDGFLLHRTWYDHPEIPDAVSLLGVSSCTTSTLAASSGSSPSS